MADDHDRLDDLFSQYRTDRTQPSAHEAFYHFKEGIEVHIDWEEDILFPLFEERTGMLNRGPTFVMRKEHKQIKGILKKIDTQINAKQFDTQLLEEELLLVLTNHNDKEESILYPGIDAVVDEEETQKVLKKLSH